MADDPNPAPTVVTDDDLVALAESIGWIDPKVSNIDGDDGVSFTLMIEGTLNGEPIKRGVENATGFTDGLHGWLADVLRESV